MRAKGKVVTCVKLPNLGMTCPSRVLRKVIKQTIFKKSKEEMLAKGYIQKFRPENNKDTSVQHNQKTI